MGYFGFDQSYCKAAQKPWTQRGGKRVRAFGANGELRANGETKPLWDPWL